jgi:hypothetical protein
MKRTVGTIRMVVAGMVLMGGALGMFGDMKSAAVNEAFPRVLRTEQVQKARVYKGETTPAMTRGLSLVARGRSREGDPCVPIAPVTFSARGPMIC